MFNEAGSVNKPDKVAYLLKSSNGFLYVFGKTHSPLMAL